MKKIPLLISILSVLGICESVAQSRFKDREMTHSSYSVPQRFGRFDITNKNNYKDLDYIYLMAMPRWIAEDFDLTQEQINEKYVDNFVYEELERGMPEVPELIKNLHKTDCKILCSFPSKGYDVIAKDPQRRMKFARMMAAFAEKFDYDGVDLDWEGTITHPLHVAFMSDIRKALDELPTTKTYLLTTALNTSHRFTQKQADILSECVDWINIMSYDMGGGFWSKSTLSHNTSLGKLKEQMEKNWSVFSPDKICIGLANYGYGYRNIAPHTQIPDNFNLAKNYFTVCYNQLQDYISKGWVERWDDYAAAPYFYSASGNDFFTIDTPKAINLKLDWAYNSGYRGVFWWEFHMDIERTSKNSKRIKHLLMDDVTEYLKEMK